MSNQDILENNLSVFEFNGEQSSVGQSVQKGNYQEPNDVAQIEPDDFFEEAFFADDCDPAGGYGLASHI